MKTHKKKHQMKKKNHIKEEKSTNYSGIIVYFIFYKPLFYQQFEIKKKGDHLAGWNLS